MALARANLKLPYHISSRRSMDPMFLSLTVSSISVSAGYSYHAMLPSVVAGMHTCVPRMHSRTPMISLRLLPYNYYYSASIKNKKKPLVLFVSHNAIRT